jgi:hypothetical protein
MFRELEEEVKKSEKEKSYVLRLYVTGHPRHHRFDYIQEAEGFQGPVWREVGWGCSPERLRIFISLSSGATILSALRVRILSVSFDEVSDEVGDFVDRR